MRLVVPWRSETRLGWVPVALFLVQRRDVTGSPDATTAQPCALGEEQNSDPSHGEDAAG